MNTGAGLATTKMVTKSRQKKLRSLITEAIRVLCKNGLDTDYQVIYGFTLPIINNKTCHSRSLFWTGTCTVRPLYVVHLLDNSLDLRFVLPLPCKLTCLVRPLSVEKNSGFKSGFTVSVLARQLSR